LRFFEEVRARDHGEIQYRFRAFGVCDEKVSRSGTQRKSAVDGPALDRRKQHGFPMP